MEDCRKDQAKNTVKLKAKIAFTKILDCRNKCILFVNRMQKNRLPI
jgi:hypothetical protein